MWSNSTNQRPVLWQLANERKVVGGYTLSWVGTKNINPFLVWKPISKENIELAHKIHFEPWHKIPPLLFCSYHLCSKLKSHFVPESNSYGRHPRSSWHGFSCLYCLNPGDPGHHWDIAYNNEYWAWLLKVSHLLQTSWSKYPSVQACIKISLLTARVPARVLIWRFWQFLFLPRFDARPPLCTSPIFVNCTSDS